MITVIVYGHALRQLVEQTEIQCEAATPITVKALLEAHADQLRGVVVLMAKGELLVTVNRKVATLDSLVRDGDTVKLTHQFNPVVDGAAWHNP